MKKVIYEGLNLHQLKQFDKICNNLIIYFQRINKFKIKIYQSIIEFEGYY